MMLKREYNGNGTRVEINRILKQYYDESRKENIT